MSKYEKHVRASFTRGFDGQLELHVQESYHTPECFHALNKRIDWCLEYTNACRVCDAAGTRYFQTGDGWHEPADIDAEPCPWCLGSGICPRCGKELLSSPTNLQEPGEERCDYCGWDVNNPEPSMPYRECLCHLDRNLPFGQALIVPLDMLRCAIFGFGEEEILRVLKEGDPDGNKARAYRLANVDDRAS